MVQTNKPRRKLLSNPYNFSKTIVANVKADGEKTQGIGETLSEGSPMLAMEFYPPRAFPRPISFGNGIPGLIGWYPRPILALGELQSWENSFFTHHAAPLGFLVRKISRVL